MSGKIETFVIEKLKPILDEESLELWDVKISKEGKNNFLRIFMILTVPSSISGISNSNSPLMKPG